MKIVVIAVMVVVVAYSLRFKHEVDSQLMKFGAKNNELWRNGYSNEFRQGNKIVETLDGKIKHFKNHQRQVHNQDDDGFMDYQDFGGDSGYDNNEEIDQGDDSIKIQQDSEQRSNQQLSDAAKQQAADELLTDAQRQQLADTQTIPKQNKSSQEDNPSGKIGISSISKLEDKVKRGQDKINMDRFVLDSKKVTYVDGSNAGKIDSGSSQKDSWSGLSSFSLFNFPTTSISSLFNDNSDESTNSNGQSSIDVDQPVSDVDNQLDDDGSTSVISVKKSSIDDFNPNDFQQFNPEDFDQITLVDQTDNQTTYFAQQKIQEFDPQQIQFLQTNSTQL